MSIHMYAAVMHDCLDVDDVVENDNANDDERVVFEKFDTLLHGKARKAAQETYTMAFIKRYIHYAKSRIKPQLTHEVRGRYLGIRGAG